MSALALDTHRTVKRLMEAGFSSEQAETVTDVLQETRTSDLSELATKAEIRALQGDLRTVEAALKSELKTIEATLTGKIAENGRITLQWTVGLLVALTAIIAGLIKLLAGH